MDRHVRTTFAVIATLALMMAGIACSVAPEEKLVRDFFRASRLRDYAALGTFATATFDPQSDGQVQNLKVISVSPERSTPYPIKQYAKAFDDAKAADDSFTRDKNDYQRVNLDAIKRVVNAEVTKKPIDKKDVPIKDSWEKLRDDSAKHAKTVSDARVELNRVKGLAELSLSRPNGPTPDVTKFDGNLVQKDVTVDATVAPPQGPAGAEDAHGDDRTMRWQRRRRQGRHRPVDRDARQGRVRSRKTCCRRAHARGCDLPLASSFSCCSSPRCFLRVAGTATHRNAPPPSTPLVPLSPKGASSYPFTFSWSGVGAADVVHITVVDAAERQLMEFDARGTSAPMPPRLSELIRPGERFSWRVATVDEGGEATRASEWAAVTREK